MREIIYLSASKNGVSKFIRKNLPTDLSTGEIPIKVIVEIADDAFAPPVLEQSINIQNPYKGIDLEDVHFNGSVISESEAELIRQKRLEKAASILRANNYTVTAPEVEEDE